MIVRDEAHVIAEALACAVPLIDRWVIVDTGSTDGTPELIERIFADAGIPGEIHHRPWVDFGHNRSEALDLVPEDVDYAWVLDADDIVAGDLDLGAVDDADAYQLRFGPGTVYWRTQILSTRRPWRFEGVVHEYPTCDADSVDIRRLDGDYHVESRRLGARNLADGKYDRDCASLQSAVDADPTDARSRFYLAQSHLDAGRPAVAAEHYRIRADMAGFEEERFVAAWRRAQALERADADPDLVRGAYLGAHQRRPQRAEPLHDLARYSRLRGDHHVAHMAATAAFGIPFPSDDVLFVERDVYDWKAQDEAAIAAYWVGRHDESLRLADQLLWSPQFPVAARERILVNRDFAAEQMLTAPVPHPAALVTALSTTRPAIDADVTVTITTCMRRHLFETTLDSFLTSVSDLDRVVRWICIDDGSSDDDLREMRRRYPFLEVLTKDTGAQGHGSSMNLAVDMVETRRWLSLEDDWRFFSPGPLISRAVEILDSDGDVSQVVFNRNYATTLAERDIVGGRLRSTPGGLVYRVHDHHLDPPTGLSNAHWPHFTLQPSLIDVERLRSVGRFENQPGFEWEFARRYADAGHVTAFFDTTSSVHIGAAIDENGQTTDNAYGLAGRPQWRDTDADISGAEISGAEGEDGSPNAGESRE